MKKFIYIIIISIVFGSQLYSQKVDVSPVDFNSSADDFSPSLTKHGRLMYFTTARDDNQQIYYVERSSKGWENPREVRGIVNNGEMVGSPTLSPDGLFMIFAAYEHDVDGQGRTDLYSAERIDGKWKNVVNLGSNVNSGFWDTQPTLSSDGMYLYFVSDRSGGYGGTDIYVSRRTKKGWSKAENVGNVINTSSDEIAPIIGADDKLFTYASNKAGGMGGFDIYISKIKNDKFNTPKNAGDAINTAYDEMFYYPVANTKYAYFSSNRPNGSGEIDNYLLVPNPYPTDAVVLVQGVVRDAKTKETLGANIAVTDLTTSQRVTDLRSDDETGNYYVILQPGRNYSITAQKNGYLFYSEKFKIAPTDEGHEETRDIDLSPIEGGQTRLLIFFDFDKTDLQNESVPELERVVEFLRDYPDKIIMLEGHTDDVGNDEYNDKLSLNRAEAAKKYLLDAGIDGNRIQTKGFGKRNPLIKEKTDEARSMNRRVEMKILN